ncbi:MAG: hypothetical protein IKN43_15155 [Selenomonadaceae bacterium]|nr:hypothetical protein [Selenomonadaceae bacterium]
MTFTVELKKQWREGKEESIKEASAKYETRIKDYEAEISRLRKALSKTQTT